MHLDIHLIAGFQVGELKQRRIKNNAVGIPDLGNGLDHGDTMFYQPGDVKGELGTGKRTDPSSYRANSLQLLIAGGKERRTTDQVRLLVDNESGDGLDSVHV